MPRTSIYLNFPRNTEEAFLFYQSVFGGDFVGGIHRMSEVPPTAGQPPLAEADKNLIMHMSLPIMGGFLLSGTDAPESMGFNVVKGNNMFISIEPETREETTQLFNKLSAGGKVTLALQDMFWGALYGTCTDQFGIQWMFNCMEKK